MKDFEKWVGMIFISIFVIGLSAVVVSFWREPALKTATEPPVQAPNGFLSLKKCMAPEHQRRHEELFSENEIRISVVFGYKDARPARFVADRYESLLFISRILTECSSSTPLDFSCGFTRASDSDLGPNSDSNSDLREMNLFQRSVRGPDGKNREVKLRVVQSAAGADDEENRRDPFQKWKSTQAKRAFDTALRDEDVVFYNGHSRAGGGPDFSPPELSAGKTVHFPYYQKKKAGLELILGSLKGREDGELRILGLFSCASTGHFLRTIKAAEPDLSALVEPKLLYFSDALENSLKALSSILNQNCDDRFQRTLR